MKADPPKRTASALAVKSLIAPPRQNQAIIAELIPDMTMTAIAEPDQVTAHPAAAFESG